MKENLPVVYRGGNHHVICDEEKHIVIPHDGSKPYVACKCKEWAGGGPAKKAKDEESVKGKNTSAEVDKKI